MGLNYYNFNMDLKDLSQNPDIFGVESEALPGYNINIISNLRLSEHFDLRFTLALQPLCVDYISI